MVGAGLVVGSGGNLSARIPGTDECWVTARGTWLDRLAPADFVCVNISTAEVVADRQSSTTPVLSAAGSARPTTELELHLAAYRTRADVAAVVHLHPQGVLLLDALDVEIRLVTTDHLFYLRRIARTRYAPPGSVELAERVAAACADGTDCVLLAQHGCSVFAGSVELAHKRALYLEEAARLTYGALALNALDRLPAPPAMPSTI